MEENHKATSAAVAAFPCAVSDGTRKWKLI
jgi:hypothetical protein